MTAKVNLNIFNMRCAPLEHVKGKCEWDFGSESPQWFVIRLVCFARLRNYTTYRAFAPIEEMIISVPPQQGIIDFAFKLPGFPYSFEGKLFCVEYAIETEIEGNDASQTMIECAPPR